MKYQFFTINIWIYGKDYVPLCQNKPKVRKIYNIRLKDEPDARIKAIKKFKDAFELRLVEAKERVDKLLSDRIIETDTHFYNIISWESASWFEHNMKEIFDCELDNDDRPSNENIREPDDATKEALAWRDSLSEKEQEMIKLIGAWDNPIAFGYAAVC